MTLENQFKMETFKTIKCSQIITKNRIEKESEELDEYFETSRKRKFAEVENEFVGAADLSLFTITAVNTILPISKETAPKYTFPEFLNYAKTVVTHFCGKKASDSNTLSASLLIFKISHPLEKKKCNF